MHALGEGTAPVPILTLLVEYDDAEKLPEFFASFAKRTEKFGLTQHTESYVCPDGLRVSVLKFESDLSTIHAYSGRPPQGTG